MDSKVNAVAERASLERLVDPDDEAEGDTRLRLRPRPMGDDGRGCREATRADIDSMTVAWWVGNC